MTTATTAQGIAEGPPIDGPVVTKHLSRVFGETTAVDSIDLTIRSGDIFGLLGPNGAGKTTTLKMLTTLLPPTSGSAVVAGADIVREPALVRRGIGYVPQLVSADGSLTGRENLLLSSRLYHLPRETRTQDIATALEFMGLAEVGDRMVRTYSGGMVRRLELAQAMLHHPAVLFLDEPTVGLDPTARATVWERIRRLRERDGTTVLLTTHYMDEADELCDRIAVMHAGRLAAVGTPRELKDIVGPGATLEEVFADFTGADLEIGGSFRDIGRTRRTAKRLG